jgi:hypothetical protein
MSKVNTGYNDVLQKYYGANVNNIEEIKILKII